jgi:hypothetical protein
MGDWNGFPPLLWLWAVPLLLHGADRLLRFDARPLRALAPLLLLLGGICLHSQLGELALRCQGALFGSAPVQFFGQALQLPLS